MRTLFFTIILALFLSKVAIAQQWADCDTVRTYLIEFNGIPVDTPEHRFNDALASVALQTGIPIKNLGVTSYLYSDYSEYFPALVMDEVFPILLGNDFEYPPEIQDELRRIEDDVKPDLIFVEVPRIAFGATSSTPSQIPVRRAIFSADYTEDSYAYLAGHQLMHLMGVFTHRNDEPNLMYWGEDSTQFSLAIHPDDIATVQDVFRESVFFNNPNRSCDVNAVVEIEAGIMYYHNKTIKGLRSNIGSKYCICNITGQILDCGLLQEDHLNVSGIKSGLYILIIGNKVLKFYHEDHY
ncbi:MAG: hypothetical protein AAGA77_25715 [Bacteroidota bacterium]